MKRFNLYNILFLITVLIILTLSVFSFDLQSKDRILLNCFNIILHELYIDSMSWMIPSGGFEVPLLVRFMRDSLVLTVFQLCLILIFRKMLEDEREVTYWISSAVTSLLESKPGELLILFDSSLKTPLKVN